MTRVVLLFLVGCTGLLGCSQSERACSDERDCFRGEVCAEGYCELAEDDTKMKGNNEPSDNNQIAQSNQNASPNNQLPENNLPENNLPENNLPENNRPEEPECVVGLVTCENDPYHPNSTWVQGERLGRLGCETTTTFLDAEWTIEARLCPSEPADFFVFDFFPCREETYAVEVTATWQTDCGDIVTLAPFSYDCEDPNVACEQGDGFSTFVLTVPASMGNSLAQYFAMEKQMRSDVMLDYEITVRTIR